MPEDVKKLPKSKKQTKMETLMKDVETLEKAFDKVKNAVHGDKDYDISEDNLGHWFSHMQNMAGEMSVIKGQVTSWIQQQEAKRIPKKEGMP